jgi:RNA polymerase sigma factor (sigma-70 family)
MSSSAGKSLAQQLRGLIRPPDGGLTDAQLLARWLAGRDEAAFELLIWRHGPTVLGVCRRLLRRAQDIEDAFQATFLVFLHKAGTIRKREAVASWLYKVAYRVASQARLQVSRQEPLDGRQVLASAAPIPDAAAWRDLRLVLDEEVSRLPLRYRTVLILCYLQGKTNEEAARELGVPVGTVQSRLSRARARLRARLTRRGVTEADGALAIVGAGEASVVLPASLVRSTLQAVLLGAPEKAAVLAKGALHAMWLTKVKMTAGLILTVTLLGGGGAFTYHTLAAGPGDETIRAARADESSQQSKDASNPRADKGPVSAEQEEIARLKKLLQKRDYQVQMAEIDKLIYQKAIQQYRALSADLTKRVKGLEEKTAHMGAVTGTVTTSAPPVDEDARDAIEILEAQLRIKRAELKGEMVEMRTAQRNLAHVNNLAERNVISKDEVQIAQDRYARQQAAVQAKEAEVYEQEIRLRQAKRRLSRLPAEKGAQRNAPPAAEGQHLKEIRKDLEQLLRKIDSLEKASSPPATDGSRP